MATDTYRAEIDGLRAVAVLAVVLFHSGLGPFRGGFVGVDVFFVISGFLITRFIEVRLEGGRFSLVEFYERRIRRIWPALFVMLLCCGLATYVLGIPSFIRDFGASLSATVSFWSNMWFWKQSGYFGTAPRLEPLLHTWSLSIEEQFYLLFPIFLVFITRYCKRLRVTVLGAVGVMSFLLGLWAVKRFPLAAFFLLPPRAWELLLGALIALGIFPEIASSRIRNLLAASGLFAILWSVVAYSPNTLFPGVAAALPCLGTALFLYANSPALTFAGRLLSVPPLVAIGLMSYSLYLWHWPLLALARHALLRAPNLQETVALVTLSFVLAFVSWKWIELPFRKPQGVFPRNRLFLFSVAAASIFFALGFVAYAKNGFSQWAGEQVARYDAARFDVNPEQRNCLERMSAERVDNDDLCILGTGGSRSNIPGHGVSSSNAMSQSAAPVQFMVWGDSHASAMMPAFQSIAEETGITGLIGSHTSCLPLLDVLRTGNLNDLPSVNEVCTAFNAAMLTAVRRHNVRKVFLVARWNAAMFGRGPYEIGLGLHEIYLADTESREVSLDENRRVFERGLRRTVARLAENGRVVYLVLDVPNTNLPTPEFLAREAKTGRIGQTATINGDQYLQQQKYIRGVVEKLSRDYAVRVMDPSEILCTGPECTIATDGRSLYSDDNHISTFGAFKLKDLLRAF